MHARGVVVSGAFLGPSAVRSLSRCRRPTCPLRSMHIWRPCVGAPLHTDNTTRRHHPLMVEESCHGEYPHPQ